VILRFDAGQVEWNRPGVTGVAMRLDVETGGHHGVYVVGAGDQVYTFLQKPTPARRRLRADCWRWAGCGRRRIAALRRRSDAALTGLADFKTIPAVDLYDQMTRGLTVSGSRLPMPDRSGEN